MCFTLQRGMSGIVNVCHNCSANILWYSKYFGFECLKKWSTEWTNHASHHCTIKMFVSVFVSSLAWGLLDAVAHKYVDFWQQRKSRRIIACCLIKSTSMLSDYHGDTDQCFRGVSFTLYARPDFSIGKEDVKSSWTLREGGRKHCRRHQAVGTAL